MCSCRVPVYVEEVRKFPEVRRPIPRPTYRPTAEQNSKSSIMIRLSTMQLMLGDVILMKLDAFQGKRKAKDR